MKNDILLILSDQHNGSYLSMNNDIDLTPNLKRICDEGAINFSNAYCNAPLCVPSRTSFLTGKLPSETKIFDNESTLNSNQITLAHKLSLLGYETILIGRMHFKGFDQFHGFEKRYLGDITTQFWGQDRDDLNDYYKLFKVSNCQDFVGFGNSPVLDYDEEVYKKTIGILNEDSERPRFILVGFYAPHFPYITNNTKIFKSSIEEFELNSKPFNIYNHLKQDTDLKKVSKINEVYKQMINKIDEYIGGIFDKFYDNNDKGIFIYTSDHGDMLGKKKIFGKKTLYEDSIKIPMIVKNLYDCNSNTKINDLLSLHHDIVKYANTGKEIIKDDKKKVIIQQILENDENTYWTEAVIDGKIKYINLNNRYYKIDLENDKFEENYAELENYPYFTNKSIIKDLLDFYKNQRLNNKLLIKYGKQLGIDSNYKFEIKDKFNKKYKMIEVNDE